MHRPLYWTLADMPPDAATLAALHARCFTTPPPWSAAAFATLLADPACVVEHGAHGFAIARIALDEAELLTICIAPESQNQGAGWRLLAALHSRLHSLGVRQVFLEVAANNSPARALYAASGYGAAGIRPKYYISPDKTAVDALILHRPL
ncbi:GNAT family N-acetyltransferase [Abyssibius alkaniclasticus]|uniref:GNAT family N-acetyltransferase n=1 Tax=Abyssibius alkaniclasticus TaxID=2881234 RepID=UPI00236358F1|nr:GNAT family N-acetyltransferase [Abyssibius alkaniclasticus]UPH71598.1 GNAT family N-acetyltransferase [Abyssibius alkaniclasticus]